jgi:flagellar basal-body rod modification protein FlgD
MSTIANSLSSQIVNSGATSTTKSGPDALTSKDTFLKLLVAQLKNQDPTNPTDSTQFVGQLTQYSELEQLIGINGSVQKLTTPASATASTTPSATPSATTTPDKPTAA